MLLSVGDIERFNFKVQGAETIAYSIDGYAIVEELYLRSRSLTPTKLQNRLTVLYTHILRFLIKAKQQTFRDKYRGTHAKGFDGLQSRI